MLDTTKEMRRETRGYTLHRLELLRGDIGHLTNMEIAHLTHAWFGHFYHTDS
jgi:hypothetical protein